MSHSCSYNLVINIDLKEKKKEVSLTGIDLILTVHQPDICSIFTLGPFEIVNLFVVGFEVVVVFKAFV